MLHNFYLSEKMEVKKACTNKILWQSPELNGLNFTLTFVTKQQTKSKLNFALSPIII